MHRQTLRQTHGHPQIQIHRPMHRNLSIILDKYKFYVKFLMNGKVSKKLFKSEERNTISMVCVKQKDKLIHIFYTKMYKNYNLCQAVRPSLPPCSFNSLTEG